MDTRRGNQGGSYITEANWRDAAVVQRMSKSELQLTGQLVEARSQRDIAIDKQSAADARANRYLHLLQRLEPHLDAIICFASTQGEHLPNKLADEVRKEISYAKTRTQAVEA